MIDPKINTVIDLETAKDKLRVSLTNLENTVEDKIRKVKTEAANNNSANSLNSTKDLELLRKNLDNSNAELSEITSENTNLKNQISLSEEEITDLKEVQKNIMSKVDSIIKKVENEIEIRNTTEEECQL